MTKIEVVKKKLKIVMINIKVFKNKSNKGTTKIEVNNENNVPPAQLQKTPLSRKGILAAVPIC